MRHEESSKAEDGPLCGRSHVQVFFHAEGTFLNEERHLRNTDGTGSVIFYGNKAIKRNEECIRPNIYNQVIFHHVKGKDVS